ncbi:MAG: cytochrome C [Sulfurimonas sp.]|uniref:cytochrome C n=1 Tax=Sulfurimonas sp. TaxID=2022749 RepID=UPI0025D3C5C6|nr:cytochrome C [Sulfurimonas sp.]MCK9454344.1 cytochrome C [Sulfurimonas sp.]
MRKFLMFVLLISVFTSLNLSAAIYKGQREFVRNCAKCHKAGQAFVATKRKIEWRSYTRAKGDRLKDIHLESKEASKSHRYFSSKKFSKNVRHLEDFLLEYAKDSGNVPACN